MNESIVAKQDGAVLDSRLWLLWALAGAVGYGAGGTLGVALGQPGWVIENGFMSIALGGVFTGVLQWTVLRTRLPSSAAWILAPMLSAAVFGAVVFGGMKIHTDAAWILGAAAFSPLAGYLQWRFVLSRHLDRGALLWVLSCLLAFFAGGIGGAFVAVPFGLEDKAGGLDAAVVWTVFGAVFGATTGLVLGRLFRRQAHSPVRG